MIQKSLQNNKIDYTVSCVSLFATQHNLSKKDAFQYLDKNKAISFLKQHYDIEHTLSLDEALRKLYSSHIFEKLTDTETGLYRESAAYIYQYYLEEQK